MDDHFLKHFLAKHGLVLSGLFLLFVTAFGAFPAAARPFDFDDTHAIAFGAQPDPTIALFGRTQASMPFYRPVPYLSFWAQYQFVGVNAYGYYMVNLIIWVGTATLLYAVVYTLARSRVAAATVALLLAFDIRAAVAMYWISGRQASLVVLFGGAALFLTIVPWRDRFRPLTWAVVYLLLLVSALSYEFGLAFSAGLVAVVILRKDPAWRGLSAIAIAAAVTYLLMRQILGPGFSAGSYCDDMGFFMTTHRVCYDVIDFGQRLQQYAYNVGANFVGVIFPSVFDQFGTLSFNPFTLTQLSALGTDFLIFALALTGWRRMPRRTLPFLALIVFNAMLGFLIFRQRTHLPGLAGLYISAGVGLVGVLAYLRTHAWLAQVALAIVLIAVITSHSLQMQDRLFNTIRNKRAFGNPCSLVSEPYYVSPELLRDILMANGLDDPQCE